METTKVDNISNTNNLVYWINPYYHSVRHSSLGNHASAHAGSGGGVLILPIDSKVANG